MIIIIKLFLVTDLDQTGMNNSVKFHFSMDSLTLGGLKILEAQGTT
jgi:hypothetical protein